MNILNISKTIGFLHLCGMVTENIYGLVIPKNTYYDQCYMTIFLSIPFSWLLFKNECLISYLIKKHENPQYIIGSNPENANDISDLFPNLNVYTVFYHINYGLRIVSVFTVNYRTTQIQLNIFIPTLLMYTIYIQDIHCKTEYTNHRIFKILFSGILCVSLYHTIPRFF